MPRVESNSTKVSKIEIKIFNAEHGDLRVVRFYDIKGKQIDKYECHSADDLIEKIILYANDSQLQPFRLSHKQSD